MRERERETDKERERETQRHRERERALKGLYCEREGENTTEWPEKINRPVILQIRLTTLDIF